MLAIILVTIQLFVAIVLQAKPLPLNESFANFDTDQDSFKSDSWAKFDQSFDEIEINKAVTPATTTTTITATTTTTTTTAATTRSVVTSTYCPWPPCYKNPWDVDYNKIPILNDTVVAETTLKSSGTESSAESKNAEIIVVDSEEEARLKIQAEDCGKTAIIVKENTSSALIIMGIFFCVVVIGLFYYLPKWSPGARKNERQPWNDHDDHINRNSRNFLPSGNSNIYEQVKQDVDCDELPRALQNSDKNAF
jgi:hypothetical protein